MPAIANLSKYGLITDLGLIKPYIVLETLIRENKHENQNYMDAHCQTLVALQYCDLRCGFMETIRYFWIFTP